jgi:hypothetical protein
MRSYINEALKEGAMIKITVDASQLRNLETQLRQEVKKVAQSEISSRERKARALTCPEHGEHPKFTRTETTGGYAWRVEGCCDDLVIQAQKVLAS